MSKNMRNAKPSRLATLPAPTDRGNYFQEVIAELRKVVWPTRDELWRMTGIVTTTVIIFALIIGGADLVLGFGFKQLYTPGAHH